MVKIKDIAEKCGVSIATVSKALNGSHELSSETTLMICEKAKEMGYIPNANARTLKTNRSYNIGILFVDHTASGLQHEYFSSILNSLKVLCEKKGYDVTFISDNVSKNAMSYYEHAKYRNVDGVVIACVDFKNPDVIRLVESEIPTVTIDYVYNGSTAIISDNVNGLDSIVKYVYECGHRKIAFIHGEDTDVTTKRLAGFHKACAELGLNIPPEYIKTAAYHVASASGHATRELLNLKEPPTCIIYPDDYSILGGMTEIDKHCLSVPNDISIVGYDGINLSRLLRPVLTTYVQDTEAIGRLAAEKLIAEIENPKMFFPEQVVVTGKLQKGDTVLSFKNAE